MPKKSFFPPRLSSNAQKARKLWGGTRSAQLIGEMDFRHNLKKVKIIMDAKGNLKGLIAKTSHRELTFFVYYPQYRHFEIFDGANLHVRTNGPSQTFRGSVGSAAVARRAVQGKECFLVEDLQGHFKQGHPKELTRNLATKYGGLRNRLLNEIFNEAESENLPVALMYSEPSKEAKRSEPIRKQIFAEIAKARGYEIHESGGFLLAEKGQP